MSNETEIRGIVRSFLIAVMSIMAFSAAEPTVWSWCHELLAAVIAHFRIAEYAILTYNWES